MNEKYFKHPKTNGLMWTKTKELFSTYPKYSSHFTSYNIISVQQQDKEGKYSIRCEGFDNAYANFSCICTSLEDALTASIRIAADLCEKEKELLLRHQKNYEISANELRGML